MANSPHHPLSALYHALTAPLYSAHGDVDAGVLDQFCARAKKHADKHGRVTPDLQTVLLAVEHTFFDDFSPVCQAKFQTLVAELGAKMMHACDIPANTTPFWLLESNELYNYQSKPDGISDDVDIVVIGSGLTGSSAAFHLRAAAQSGQRILLLEREAMPAAQASGRNGGNFQMMSESHVGTYDGLVGERLEWLRACRDLNDPQCANMTDDMLLKRATGQAQLLMNFTMQNLDKFNLLIRNYNIDCDHSPGGWLRIAHSEAEETLLTGDRHKFFKKKSQSKAFTANEIKHTYKISTDRSGLLLLQNGNYHPFKFVCELIRKCVEAGVEFYTNTSVVSITRELSNQGVQIEVVQSVNSTQNKRNTQALPLRRVIRAKRVIVATNAFIPELFPELREVRCVMSQIANFEHVADHLHGATVTEREGDIYYNFPMSRKYDDSSIQEHRGMLHYGLDHTTAVVALRELQVSRTVFNEILSLVRKRFPGTHHQPPSRMWVGPMALTPDRIPLIGFLRDHRKATSATAEAAAATAAFVSHNKESASPIIIAAAFQGFGGSFCVHAGAVVAYMATHGSEHPDVPVDMFSPNRFFHMSDKTRHLLMKQLLETDKAQAVYMPLSSSKV
jgi:glycine/D-amino acid oxidase-like deaminating enzyme